MQLHEDITTLINQVKGLADRKVVQWASHTYRNGLYALSSFGVDSAVMFELMKQAKVNIPVIMIDTGFLFKETHQFKEEMAKRYNLDVITCKPKNDVIEYVKKERLWESYPELYHDLVKIDPLRTAISEHKIKALLSGIRGGQTKVRAKKNVVEIGNSGEIRIHPLLNWSEKKVEDFIAKNNLPRHPLFYEGYASVGDWTTTTKGASREESRIKMGDKFECGLHLDSSGRVIPSPLKESR